MGKKNQYVDDYMGDVASIRKRHKKIRVLMAALCTAGVVAAGSATYVLMNPAQTMTKEGIDEMDPNEDFVVKDDDPVTADQIPDEELLRPADNYASVPLIEEWNEDDQAPPDAFPTEPAPPAEPALAGGEPAADGAQTADGGQGSDAALDAGVSQAADAAIAQGTDAGTPETAAPAEGGEAAIAADPSAGANGPEEEETEPEGAVDNAQEAAQAD